MNPPLSRLEVLEDRDVVRARQHARAIAGGLGFNPSERVAIAWAVSEVAAASLRHTGGGRVEFHLDGDPARSLAIRVFDHAPAPLDACDGLCLDAARQVMDDVEVDAPAGLVASIAMRKSLPSQAPPPDLAKLVEELNSLDPVSTSEESLRQDRELHQALQALEVRDRELSQANRELDETNRGVLALYVELDEQADSLRRAIEIKTRFLANISHELRTPLSSILGLTRLLLDRADGDLTSGQEQQVSYISQSAQELVGLVNELLDLARIEAGHEEIRPSDVHIPELFGMLRGLLRPLLPAGSTVELIIDDPIGLPAMVTDDAKLAQILRNFLSNALKFTERGEVRLQAEPGPGDTIVFSVSDTGIGIAPEHIPRIFEEFGQVDGPLQRRSKGTGLGLPVARRFAQMLGGGVDVRSEPGVGSTFSATIPVRYSGQVVSRHESSPDENRG